LITECFVWLILGTVPLPPSKLNHNGELGNGELDGTALFSMPLICLHGNWLE